VSGQQDESEVVQFSKNEEVETKDAVHSIHGKRHHAWISMGGRGFEN
jgi:hypothetical protein